MKSTPSPGKDESSLNIWGLQLIFDHLEKYKKIDLSRYKPDILIKRVQERMTQRNCSDPEKYLVLLQKDPEETDILAGSFLVGYSLFFRDPLIYEYLGAEVLPDIAMTKRTMGDNLLRIWSCGCYTGEEPYSVALLVLELKEKGFLNLETSVFGTDINIEALEKARSGCYSEGALENTRLGMIKRFFHQVDEMFCLGTEVKEMVNFSSYDLLSSRQSSPSESVFKTFDIILCRNVVLYLEQEKRKTVFEKLYRNLAVGGYLVLGQAEVLPAGFAGSMEEIHKSCRIYYKIY